MGGKRLVRRLTSKELAKRIIKEKTENIALQCVKCRAMYELRTNFLMAVFVLIAVRLVKQ